MFRGAEFEDLALFEDGPGCFSADFEDEDSFDHLPRDVRKLIERRMMTNGKLSQMGVMRTRNCS